MRFLSVADRELRSAARQKATYRTRWLTAALFFGLLLWLLWVFNGFTNQRVAPQIFKVSSFLTLLYCLVLSTARTADCISGERREGTLGLLFLTNLNSAEIIAGKLCSSALASVYGLMAIFPMLALPMLMGGITFEWFARAVLALLNGILFALAAGFLASVVCKRQFTAVTLALGLAISVAGGLMLGAAVANSFARTRPLGSWLAAFSPIYTLLVANGAPLLGPNRFWFSAAVVAGLSLSWLGLTTLLLARTWRDRPKRVRPWHRLRLWRRSDRTPSLPRAAQRRRMLEINPVFWLAARQPVSAPVFMVLSLVLTLITVYVAAPLFARAMKGEPAAPVLGYLLAWFFAGLAIHALVLYYAALTASQRLAEDKQSGALELILCTPTTDRTLLRGLWLAYARKMLFPAILAVLVFFFLIWIFMVMVSFDPPGHLPPGVTAGELFWGALLDQPVRGRVLYWQFGFMLHAGLLILLQLILTWPTLGWVGRWLGLRMKHPGFAPVVSLALLLVPPVLLFSLAVYLADKFHLARLPTRQFMPLMLGLGLGIGCGHCLVLSAWAATRLRHNLRAIAMSRYQPPLTWRWRLPSWRMVGRFALGAAVGLAVVVLLVASYYGYQNWSSQRAWRKFQAELKQRGEALSLSQLLPMPVSDAANFARSPVFLGMLSKTNTEGVALLEQIRAASLMDWTGQNPAPLYPFTNTPGRASVLASPDSRRFPGQQGAARISPRPPRAALPTRPRGDFETNRVEEAAAVLQRLRPQTEALRELAAAAARCTAFQTSTNRDAGAVLHPAQEPPRLLEGLHQIFQVRACASLALGRGADAGEDVLTGLRLARLARQLPDVGATVRAQRMVTRSLQPLWEGLNQHAWTEPQLAAFQHDLAGFNLLADYTNGVQRAVVAHIDVWHAFQQSGNRSFPRPDGMYAIVNNSNPSSAPAAARDDSLRNRLWQLQPRAWWFEFCIQLYEAGRNAIEQVDAASGRIQQLAEWSDLDGLPLDSQTRELILPWSWWWNATPASVAFAQTAVNQAIIACALERFRLANGTYPQTLEQLVPGLLARVPHDAISGRPVIYQPPAEGPLILRGVGPNGVDDRKNKSSDDWLWTYSTNSPSAKK